jgi:hypothetical protein
MIGAGLLARNAVDKGLARKPSPEAPSPTADPAIEGKAPS